MPNRILRESILTSDRVNQLDASEERFYRRLMSVVDDFGRFDGRHSIVRAACFPLLLEKVREADVQRWMAACQKAGLVVLYESTSKPYLQLLNLGEPRAKSSKFPDPPTSARTRAQTHASVPYSPTPAPTPPNSLAPTGKDIGNLGAKGVGAVGAAVGGGNFGETLSREAQLAMMNQPEHRINDIAESRALLKEIGVSEKMTAKLVLSPIVTPDRIRAEISDINSKNGVKNVAAVLINRLGYRKRSRK